MDISDLPDVIHLVRAAVWLEPGGDVLKLGAVAAEPESVQLAAAKALGMTTPAVKALGDPPEAAPDGAFPLYDLALVRRADVQKVAPAAHVAPTRFKSITKSEAKRVIYYVLYEPEKNDAHGDRMSEDDVAEMMWNSAGCRRVKVEHGFDQGLKRTFGKDELQASEGHVVEHYLLDHEVAPGGTFHGAVIKEGIKRGAGIEAIRYSPEVYATLSKIEHGISLGGRAMTETR